MAGVGITTWCLVGVLALALGLIGWTLIGDADRTVLNLVADEKEPVVPDGRHREDGTTQRIVPPPLPPRPIRPGGAPDDSQAWSWPAN